MVGINPDFSFDWSTVMVCTRYLKRCRDVEMHICFHFLFCCSISFVNQSFKKKNLSYSLLWYTIACCGIFFFRFAEQICFITTFMGLCFQYGKIAHIHIIYAVEFLIVFCLFSFWENVVVGKCSSVVVTMTEKFQTCI